MPHYNFFCLACKKAFSKILTISEYEKRRDRLPTLQKQKHRAAVGSLLCSDLEEKLKDGSSTRDSRRDSDRGARS
jgi:hypothetical protein